MILSACIMAHESRRYLFEPLAESLGIEVWAKVDDGSLGRWGNGRRCLLSYDSSASHHLVIQDDAVPAPDLIAGIEAWLPHLPDSILVLYSGRVRPWRHIHDRHSRPPCWLKMKSIQWGVALVIPTPIIPALVKFADRLTRVGNYDLRLSEANQKTHRLPVLVPSPSWVQHAGAPSTVAGRQAERYALNHHKQSILDWAEPGNAPIIPVPDFPRRPGGREFHQRELRRR